MNPDVLEKVLECRRLPSLPAVALRIVELTKQEAVSFKELAETIQNDQALAAKVLRTVNSSLFGLRRGCSSINQAIVMLGLAAVKSLALGFSLVAVIKDSAGEDFDMPTHWRRALYTGVAAKQIAAKAGIGNQEECFLGGLLQDVGMVALHQALGDGYLDVLDAADGDHRVVAKLELESFQLQHPDVGALLAQRWRLPDELVMPIKYHEKPTAAPAEFANICRAVGLGNIAADLLVAAEPAPILRRFYEKAEQWFGIDVPQADNVLKAISASAREVARLLMVPTGEAVDADVILDRARRQLDAIAVPGDAKPPGWPPPQGATAATHDELTGLASRLRFDQTAIAAFEQASSGMRSLAVAVFEIDRLDAIRADAGADAVDNTLLVIGGRIHSAFHGVPALVARYDNARFGVILPRTTKPDALRLCELARVGVSQAPIRLVTTRMGGPSTLKATVSAGLAVLDRSTASRFRELPAMLAIVEQAVRAAQRAGGDSLRVFAPGVAASVA